MATPASFAPPPPPHARRRLRRACGLAAVLVAVLLVLTGCGPRERPELYSARLQPIDDSGVSGTADFRRSGEHVTLEVHATGLEPERVHAQHLYGSASDSACPTTAPADPGLAGGRSGTDSGGDGGSVVSLQPYPTVDEDGDLDYQLTFTVDPEQFGQLRGGALLLQGAADAGGQYDHTVPVACGRIVRRAAQAAAGPGSPTRQIAGVTP